VCFREKVVGDGCYLATKGNAGQLCPPVSVSQEPECRMQAAVGTYLFSEHRFEAFKGDFLMCHGRG
jgi:hypothetical protein